MTNEIDQKIINALKTVFDPEIPVDIYELGLIYKCEVTPGNDVLIDMTLTCLLYTSPSPRDKRQSRMPSSG